MTDVQQPSAGARATITVDLDAVRHNVALLRETVAPAAMMTVVKADGYGHGLLAVAARPRARPAPTGWASPSSRRRSRCAPTETGDAS